MFEEEQEQDREIVHQILCEVLGENYMNEPYDDDDDSSRKSSVDIQALIEEQNISSNSLLSGREVKAGCLENNKNGFEYGQVENILRVIDKNEKNKQSNQDLAWESEQDDDNSSQALDNSQIIKEQANDDMLDEVGRQELNDLIISAQDIQKADRKFPQIFTQIQEQNFVQGDNINFYLHNLVYKFSQKHSQFLFTCFQIYQENNCLERLCLGCQDGSFVVLDANPNSGQENYTFFKLNQQVHGAISCIDVSYNGNFIATGFADGTLGYWDISKKQCVKVISNLFDSTILQVKFLNAEQLIASDNSGNIVITKIKKNLFAYNNENKVLIQNSSSPFYQIKLRRTIFNQQGQQKACLLAALVSIEFILIVMVEPYVVNITRIENEQNNKMIYFSWTPIIQNTPPQFAISCDTLIKVYQIDSIKEDASQKIIKKISFQSYFYSEKEILFMEFLNENLIFYLDPNNLISIVAVNKFRSSDTFQIIPQNTIVENRYILKHDEIKEAVVYRDLLKSEVYYHMFVKTNNELIRSCYANSVHVYNQTIYILDSRNIVNAQLQFWESYINKLIEKSDWIQALFKLIQIFEGKDLLYSHLSSQKLERQKQIQHFVESISRRYIEEVASILSEQNSEELWIMRISTLTEFLLHLEFYDFIFEDLMIMFENIRADQYFIKILEPFILRGQIKAVPALAFRKILNYFYSEAKDKIHLVKKLIVNLDLDKIDIDNMIRICNEKKLFSMLAYLYPKNNLDFRTPALVCYANYLQGQKLDTKTAYFCLWYLRYTLQGYMFPNDFLDFKSQTAAVIQLVQWIFVKETLEELIKIDCFFMFEIILLFFEKPCSTIIEQNNNELYKLLEIDNKIKTRKQINEKEIDLLDTTPPVHSLMIQLVQECIKQNNVDEIQCFHHLILEVSYRDFEVSHTMAIECAQFFFESPDSSFYRNKKNMSIDYKSERLIKLLSTYESQINTKGKIQKLVQKARYSPFIEVCAFLCFINQEYQECIDLYLLSPKKHINMKIFPFLETLFEGLNKNKDNEKIKVLLQYIFTSKLKDLVRLDSEKTKEFIEKFTTAGEADQAIEQLSQFPELQFKLLDKIIQSKRNRQQDIPEHLLVLQLELVAKLNPARVLFELKSFDYPLDESLKISLKYGILDATAYLYERSGDITKSINLYFEVFKGKLSQLITYPDINENKLTHLTQFIKPCLEICISHNKKGDKESEENWFLVVDNVINIQKKTVAEFQFDKRIIINFFSSVINEVVEKMVNFVKFNSFIENLLLILQIYTLKDMKSTFQRLLHDFSFEFSVLNSSISILKLNCNNQQQQILQFYSQGYSIQKQCCSCQEIIGPQDVYILFNCKHTSHQKCSFNQTYCPVCVENPEFLWIQNIFKLKVYKGSSKEQILQQERVSTGKQENPAILKKKNIFNQLNDLDQKKKELQEIQYKSIFEEVTDLY
ncbi:hypothetical protein ABPG74_011107 [Tetrahymena malaccensis]